MACIVTAGIVMACVVTAYAVTLPSNPQPTSANSWRSRSSYIVMACIVTAHTGMASIVMAFVLMAEELNLQTPGGRRALASHR